MNKIELCERTNSRQAILLIEACARPRVAVRSSKTGCVLLFVLLSAVLWPSLDAGRKTRETLDLPMKKVSDV